MIASVRGRVLHIGASAAVVEVGGVGLSVVCTPSTLASLHAGDEARLATELVVREDALTLYGFGDADERDVFVVLQSVSGIGPRLALAMLAVHEPDAIRAAVAEEDLAALTAVPGIGRKGAQRLVLELKDKLGRPAEPAVGTAAPSPAGFGWKDQVHSGLVGLGWSVKDADAALQTVQPQAEQMTTAGELNVAELLRAALRSLSKS